MKKLLTILVLTVSILFLDLYGKLLYTQYIQKPYFSKNHGKIIAKKSEQQGEVAPSAAVSNLLGSNPENLLALFGEPARVEPSSYDYEWWVYNQDLNHYMQFGIFNNKIVTIYAGGDKVDVSPFRIGQKYGSVYASAPFSNELTLESNGKTYQFELSELDLNEQPLLSVKNGWAQLYFDKFTRKLVGIRYMDDETLLKQRPYELVYAGPLLEPAPLTEEKKKMVEAANAQQILDLTNLVRIRHKLNPLSWDEKTAQVAYLHSKDMKEGRYFAHQSPTYGSLGDRLTRGSVPYLLAGENIASNYVDAIAAMHGWLNSEGHRENLLNKEFSDLGAGVEGTFYTQDFIKK